MRVLSTTPDWVKPIIAISATIAGKTNQEKNPRYIYGKRLDMQKNRTVICAVLRVCIPVKLWYFTLMEI